MSPEELARLLQLINESKSNKPRLMVGNSNAGIKLFLSNEFIGCSFSNGVPASEPILPPNLANGTGNGGSTLPSKFEVPNDSSTAGGQSALSPPNLANGTGNGGSTVPSPSKVPNDSSTAGGQSALSPPNLANGTGNGGPTVPSPSDVPAPSKAPQWTQHMKD